MVNWVYVIRRFWGWMGLAEGVVVADRGGKSVGLRWLVLSNVLAFLCFGVIAFWVASGATLDFDWAFYGYVRGVQSPFMTVLARFASAVGGVAGVIVICLLLVLWKRTRFWVGVPVAFSTAAAAVVHVVLKEIFARPRPDVLRLVEAGGFSFPSGHSADNMALYVMLAFLVFLYCKGSRRGAVAGVAAFLWVGAIGLSRVYLGVHYFSDVVGGFFLGYWVASGCFLVWRGYLGRRGIFVVN